MPTFIYTARDRNGNPIQSEIISADVGSLREQLRERDLYLTSVSMKNAGDETGAQTRMRKGRVRIDDMVVMSRQLASLVRAGLPINESLNTCAMQSESQYLREVLQQVRRDILGGNNFADAVARHPRIFPELYVALIRAGEAGGVLEETLETAAEQFDREAALRMKIKEAATYPILVVFVTIFVVAFMVLFIVPKFADAYKQMPKGGDLPAVTLALVQVSEFVVKPLVDVVVAVLIAVFVLLGRQYVTTYNGRRRWDNFKMKVWLFGKLNRKIAIARLTRTLCAMVRAGVPLIQALAISARVSNNAIIIDAMSRVAESVQQGARLWAPMEQSGEFPPMVTRMIAAGEESGNLDEMLIELTRFYERDIEYTVAKLTRLMEPLMTIMVGVVVLFIVLALYMPIFNIARQFSK